MIEQASGQMTPEDRFWKRIKFTDSCWLWTGPTRSPDSLYGFIFDKKLMPVHRFSYELLVGTIAEGLVIDHLCRVKLCVNPSHLEAVTVHENTMRGISFSAKNAIKTHCPKGHEYDKANTYLTPLAKRDCRECRRMATKRYEAKRRVLA